MNKKKLLAEISNSGFPQSSFTLFGEPKDETLCLQCAPPKWLVFYSERGLQTNKNEFLSEEAACDYFFL